jgi:hypothetical protein
MVRDSLLLQKQTIQAPHARAARGPRWTLGLGFYLFPTTVCLTNRPVKHAVFGVEVASDSFRVATPTTAAGMVTMVSAAAKGSTAAEANRDPGTCWYAGFSHSANALVDM